MGKGSMVPSWLPVLFWCCLGAMANSTIPFSLGVLQNYIFSAMYQENTSLDPNTMHIFATIILMMGCGLSWLFGVMRSCASGSNLHILIVVVMVLLTGSLKWWYCSVFGFAVYCFFYGVLTGNLHVYFSEVLSSHAANRVGLFNGLYGYCFGGSGIIGNILAAFVINPHNVQPTALINSKNTTVIMVFEDINLLSRIDSTWFIYAAIFALCYIPGLYFISIKDKEEVPILDRLSDSEMLINNKDEMVLGLTDSFTTFISSKDCYALMSCTVCIGIASLVSADLYKVYGLKVIRDDGFFNTAGIVIPIIGATGRVVWGCLFDYVPEKLIYCYNTLAMTICIICLSVSRNNKYVYIGVVSIIASTLGTMSCLAPSIIQRYRKCRFSLLLGMTMFGEVLGTGIYMIVTAFVADSVSDELQAAILAIPCLVSFLLCLVLL